MGQDTFQVQVYMTVPSKILVGLSGCKMKCTSFACEDEAWSIFGPWPTRRERTKRSQSGKEKCGVKELFAQAKQAVTAPKNKTEPFPHTTLPSPPPPSSQIWCLDNSRHQRKGQPVPQAIGKRPNASSPLLFPHPTITTPKQIGRTCRCQMR